MGGFGDAMNSKLRDNDNVRKRRSFEYYKDNPDKGQSHSAGYEVNIPKLSEEEITASKERLRIERKKSLRYDFMALFATLAFLFLLFLFFYKIFL